MFQGQGQGPALDRESKQGTVAAVVCGVHGQQPPSTHLNGAVECCGGDHDDGVERGGIVHAHPSVDKVVAAREVLVNHLTLNTHGTQQHGLW